MPAVFVLLPAGRDVERTVAEVLIGLDAAARGQLAVRSYPPADDAAHLLSLVRAGRDRVATRWLGGLCWCIASGAVLGVVTAGVLAIAGAMFGGLVGVAIAFGGLVGAFLGGFTAAMTGTEVARDEVRLLLPNVQRGSVLLSIAGRDGAALRTVRDRCEALALPWSRRDE